MVNDRLMDEQIREYVAILCEEMISGTDYVRDLASEAILRGQERDELREELEDCYAPNRRKR